MYVFPELLKPIFEIESQIKKALMFCSNHMQKIYIYSVGCATLCFTVLYKFGHTSRHRLLQQNLFAPRITISKSHACAHEFLISVDFV